MPGSVQSPARPRPDPEGWEPGGVAEALGHVCPRGGASTLGARSGHRVRTSALRGEGEPPAGPAGGERAAGGLGPRGWRLGRRRAGRAGARGWPRRHGSEPQESSGGSVVKLGLHRSSIAGNVDGYPG